MLATTAGRTRSVAAAAGRGWEGGFRAAAAVAAVVAGGGEGVVGGRAAAVAAAAAERGEGTWIAGASRSDENDNGG